MLSGSTGSLKTHLRTHPTEYAKLYGLKGSSKDGVLTTSVIDMLRNGASRKKEVQLILWLCLLI